MGLRFHRWTLSWCLAGIYLGIFALPWGSLFAQEASQNLDENSVSVRTYDIRKIYSHRLGYRIDLLDYQSRVRTIYAKISWFANSEVRDPNLETFEVAASLAYTTPSMGIPSNYMTLRYEGSKLISMSIYIDEPSAQRNNIWSAVPIQENIDDKFDIKTVTFTGPPSPPAAPVVQQDTEQN